MSSPTHWPTPPEITEPTPPRERRSWGKVSHSDRYRRQRRDLLKAAVTLAGRAGYEGTRVADIVAEAGLSKSTFYEHFDSKEECFVELHRRTSAQMLRGAVEVAEAKIEKGAYECLKAVIHSLISYSDRNPRLAAVLRAELGSSQPIVRAQSEENADRVIGFFATVASRLGSPLSEDELELTATILVRGVTDVLSNIRSDPARLDDKIAQITSLGCRAFRLEGP